ncbi:CPNA2-like protein, partial [Mya arenaria]
VICILGETLASFDDDGMIPVYGLGDSKVKDKGVFPLKDKGECDGFEDVLSVYKEITPTVKLEGPTNFAPVIDEAIRIVKEKKQYHVLVIIADGQVTNEEDTIRPSQRPQSFPCLSSS